MGLSSLVRFLWPSIPKPSQSVSNSSPSSTSRMDLFLSPSKSRKPNELMSLGEKRRAFSEDAAKLFVYILETGREYALDWAYRDSEIQKILVAQGHSKTTRSNHNFGLAVDINVDPGWDVPETYRDLGTFWESLDPQNRWGGRFGARFKGEGTRLRDMVSIGWDARHFERRP